MEALVGKFDERSQWDPGLALEIHRRGQSHLPAGPPPPRATPSKKPGCPTIADPPCPPAAKNQRSALNATSFSRCPGWLKWQAKQGARPALDTLNLIRVLRFFRAGRLPDNRGSRQPANQSHRPHRSQWAIRHGAVATTAHTGLGQRLQEQPAPSV